MIQSEWMTKEESGGSNGTSEDESLRTNFFLKNVLRPVTSSAIYSSSPLRNHSNP